MHLSNVSIASCKRFSLRTVVFVGAVILLMNSAPVLIAAQTETTQKRAFKKKEFVGMPLQVREVKNLQSETWPNDLEIEVKNISSKPIYFINAALLFPDDPAPNGKSGVILEFGNIENMAIKRIAQPEDVHLDPGQTTILQIPNIYRKGLIAKQTRTPENLKRLGFLSTSLALVTELVSRSVSSLILEATKPPAARLLAPCGLWQ